MPTSHNDGLALRSVLDCGLRAVLGPADTFGSVTTFAAWDAKVAPVLRTAKRRQAAPLAEIVGDLEVN